MSEGFSLYSPCAYIPWCAHLPWHTLALGVLLIFFGLRGAFSRRFWAEARDRAFLLEMARFMRGFQVFLVAALLFLLVLVVVPFLQAWLVLNLGLYYRAPRQWSAWLAIVPWLISLFIRRNVWAKTVRYLSAAFLLGCFAYYFVFSLYAHLLLPESLAYSREVTARLQHLQEVSGKYPDRIDPETLTGKEPPLLIRAEGNHYYEISETGYFGLNLRTIFPSYSVSFDSKDRKWRAWFSNFTE